MVRIAKSDWDRVHELACEIANAEEDEVLADSRTAALMDLLAELECKYGKRSRFTATKADYVEARDERVLLYQEALRQACAEGDRENEALILESLGEIGNGN